MSKRVWTKEECRDRYVHGLQISLKKLAIESGNSAKTIEDWSRHDTPKWSEQRRQFQGQARVDSDNKAIEQISEIKAGLATEHLRSYQSARRVIDTHFNWFNERINAVKHIPERLEAELKGTRKSDLNFLTLSLERVINGERTAAGLEWENVPKAIAYLQRLGYQVVDPTIESSNGTEGLGLSDEAAELIKVKVLGIEETYFSGNDSIHKELKNASNDESTTTGSKAKAY